MAEGAESRTTKSAWAYRWRAWPKPWFFECGGIPVLVLGPLAIVLAFFSLDWAFGVGMVSLVWIAHSARDWISLWRSVIEIRVGQGEQGRLLLRQRYGRTRSYPLSAVTALRPLQVGGISFSHVPPDWDDGYKEEDELVLRLGVDGSQFTTYNTPYSTADMQPVITALRRACPNMIVHKTEFRRVAAVDVERGMSPG
ncbi:hypothetical protein AB0K80_16880 [Streptomyces sp. NPDC052682]|uniref:hypothetical protein n=1 Tax=Streptomyces sp. NPDC052682 TaxID=3154954 RepID=UPI00343EFC20